MAKTKADPAEDPTAEAEEQESQQEIDLDAAFGVQQTPESRMMLRLAHQGIIAGHPWYHTAQFADSPRMLIITDPEGGETTIVEDEDMLRERIIGTNIRLLEEAAEAYRAFVQDQTARNKE